MFSIIIPYYKKREYLDRCLSSVYSQTFTEFEVILVDDGSDDDLADLCQNKFPSLKLIHQKNQGVSVARNTGVSKATHPYIAFLDADDYWSPYYLEYNYLVLSGNKDLKLIGSHYTQQMERIMMVAHKLQYRKIDKYFSNAIQNTLFFTSATILARSFFEFNTGFNPQLKTGEDLDVWFRAVLSGGDVFYIENTLVYYSNEDILKGLVRVNKFGDRFIANISSLYFEDGIPKYTREFHIFLSKMIYSGLFQFYRYTDPEIRKQINRILAEVKPGFFLADLYYRFPCLTRFRAFSRRYFKFIFRFIYVQ